MKTGRFLLATCGFSMVCGMGLTQAAVVYTENFPNSTGVDASLSTVGWLSNHGSGGVSYNANSTSGANPLINSAVGSGATTGFLRMSSGIGVNEPVLLWTSEIQSSSISVDDVSTVSFYMRNQTANVDIRLAIQVGGSWYVTEDVYNTATQSWLQQTVTFSSADWNSLAFTSGSNLDMGGAATLPITGQVTGIGFYTDSKPSAYLSFDALNVDAVPEPGTFLYLGLAGAFILGRRARCRVE